MNKPTVLIVDDQVPIHIVIKAMLNKEYSLEFASNAQEAIDILTEKSINLILLDIEMPELSGLELLESLMIDTALNDVPVIILTGKATEEREKEAKKFGAAAFVSKDLLMDDKGKRSMADMIKKNISEAGSRPHQHNNYKSIGTQIIKELVATARKKDFFHAARKMSVSLMNQFEIEYVSIWAIQKGKPNMLISLGDFQPPEFGPDEIKSEPAYKTLYVKRSPYLTNNANCAGKTGIFASLAMESGLSSEIGIPMFKISREDLTKNRMVVPGNTPLYGFIILKRNRVFTSREYYLLVKTLTYCSSILWILLQNMFKK